MDRELLLVETDGQINTHAGINDYRMLIKDRTLIPKDWVSPGRILLFFADRIEKGGNIYIPAIAYTKGLIYCSFADPSGWETRLVRIGDDGMPVIKWGKEDLSMYYRYVTLK